MTAGTSGARADGDLFALPADCQRLAGEAAALAERAAPYAAVADESGTVDPRMRELLAASGLCGLMVPARFGGRGETVDPLAVTVVREVLAGTSGHLDSLFAMQGIGSYALGRAGTPGLQAQWLPRAGRLEAIAALALTEPHVGSDLRAISTTVSTTSVNDSEITVNGRKSFITNAGDADFYTVLARDGDSYDLVLVPALTPGVRVEHPHQIIAPHVLGDVIFENVTVPAANRIGSPGAGFDLVLSTLACFRVSVAGAAVGVAQAALDEALAHTTAREQFGGPLARLGAVESMLALSWTEIEMARSLTYRAAAMARRDPRAALNYSSMAKVAATETAGRVTDRAVQMCGRFGLLRGGRLERLYREARPMRVYEGSTEVLLHAIARQLVKGVAARP